MSESPLIEARQVSRIYRRGSSREIRAVDGISLSVTSGSCCALTGPSGSGKSTLLALLGGLDRPTAGEVRFRGEVLKRLSDVGLARVRRRLGFIFQNFSLFPRMTVWENVTYPLIPRGVPARARLRKAAELLETWGLSDRLHSPAATLSGGEQQRVALARALVAEPEVLLADEPTSQLDRRNAEQLADALKQLHARGVTLILSTHDPLLVALAADVVALEAGRIAPR